MWRESDGSVCGVLIVLTDMLSGSDIAHDVLEVTLQGGWQIEGTGGVQWACDNWQSVGHGG